MKAKTCELPNWFETCRPGKGQDWPEWCACKTCTKMMYCTTANRRVVSCDKKDK